MTIAILGLALINHQKITIVFFSIVLKANGMINWMFKNMISRKVLKIYKNLIRFYTEYSPGLRCRFGRFGF